MNALDQPVSRAPRFVMDRVKIDLKNCYGIKELKKELDFTQTRAYAIYAPNGVMKSSLARTFLDAANGKDSVDRIFPKRKSSRKITDENNKDVDGDRVFVVVPYDADFGLNEKTSTLLVDAKLRREYEKLHIEIDKAKETLLTAVRQQAGSKANFEAEISTTFTPSGDFEVAVGRIRAELQKQKDAPLKDVQYDVIFNDKVQKALDTKDLKDLVEAYVRRYNQLLAASTYFKKGGFDYYNAGQIAKSLADHGFFDAAHTVNLKAAGGVLEINTQKELEAVVAKEKDAILKDKQLRQNFDAVEKALSRNQELRDFCHYIQDNEVLLSRMSNPAQFREDVLKSYLKAHDPLYSALMEKYDAAAKRKKEIEAEASKQRTEWENVIAIFNDRFTVPFELEAVNRIDVMLGNDPIIQLGFTYKDGAERAEIDRDSLMEVLSTGERKALYILNVIFEIRRRNKSQQETLLVVDDIADSFDYANKYAIVQYLKDVSNDGLFKLIIMTHNFDFFRTLEGRFVGYKNCLLASKNEKGVTLVPASGIRNVFANDWKKAFFTDAKKKIASIPFLRNLIEMTTGESDPNYLLLTSMLHWKSDTPKITVGQLDSLYNEICKTTGKSPDPKKLVCDMLEEEAKSAGLGDNPAGLNLEIKIVLAIAIRIAAEKFMIGKIKDDKFVAAIATNQTQALIDKFKEKFAADTASIQVLDKVALMTPENIHVNSFMYEPIVDMSDVSLKRLYAEVIKLT